MDWIIPVSSPSRTAKVEPPGTTTTGKSLSPANAIIIAGSPLSQDAIPKIPLAVGKDRACLLKTCAASFLYGSESIIPVVPCVRPSHGSEHMRENGIVLASLNSRAAASTCNANSKWPV